MKEYIDKATVKAELERRLKALNDCHADRVAGYAGEISGLKRLLSFLDTLEVKENNLVEELDYNDYMAFFKKHPDYIDGSWGFEETWTFGQYCYELGLKAQKGD